MGKTKIQWTDQTWNPITGCSPISSGCAHCYAARGAEHLRKMGQEKYKQGFKIRLHPDLLNEPYHWKKPRKIFVCSMSDLFHENLPLEFIQRVFKVMNDNPHLTFQILTKRANLMEQYSPLLDWSENIWAGTTVEDNRQYHRISHLLKTGAAVKFISAEPLLSSVADIPLEGLDWVICGGESGSGFREMKAEWALELRDKCEILGIPYFFKQWSAYNPKKLGCKLAGQEYKQFPQVNGVQHIMQTSLF